MRTGSDSSLECVPLDDDVQAADLLQEYESRATIKVRLVGEHSWMRQYDSHPDCRATNTKPDRGPRAGIGDWDAKGALQHAPRPRG